ncbi:MAG: alpha/beta fold hydrolase [Chloroflexota bacterium]|nr:alpha/beta fold hydrolase [Chloroflexota bacterium]
MQLEHIVRQPEGTPQPTPLLFMHGAWHGAWCWDEFFLPYFASKGYSAHALSLRGHGKSGGSTWLARIPDYVADLTLVARTLPTPPVLIGHSMGGYITQKFLETNSAPAAVLLASIPVMGARRFIFKSMLQHPIDALRALPGLNAGTFVDTPAKARRDFFSVSMPEEQVQRYSAQIGAESALIISDIIGLTMALPKVERITTPMLVLAAQNDAVFTVDEEQATARAYKAEFQVFPGMAHDMMLEAGWQAVADRILGWLQARGL